MTIYISIISFFIGLCIGLVLTCLCSSVKLDTYKPTEEILLRKEDVNEDYNNISKST